MVDDDVLRPRNYAAQSARVTKKVAACEDFIGDDSFWNTEMLAVRPECEHRREVKRASDGGLPTVARAWRQRKRAEVGPPGFEPGTGRL